MDPRDTGRQEASELLAAVKAVTQGMVNELSEPALADALASGYAEAQECYPEFAVSARDFVLSLSYREGRTAKHHWQPEELAKLDWPEVYLAAACRSHCKGAAEAFESQYLRTLPAALAHMKLPEADVEELVQEVREKLLVPDAGGHTRLEEYAGEGNLRGLVKVMAVRAGISRTRKQRREHHEPEDQLLRMPDMAHDPELEAMKHEMRDHFRFAFEQATRSLEVRQRNLLRLHLLDKVTLAQLATTYAVHRATVTRWLAEARSDLLRATRKNLREILEGNGEDDPSRDLDQFLSLVESRLDLSVRRLLLSQPDLS